MDPDHEPSPARRKIKFAPKAPPKRKPKPPASITEVSDEHQEDTAQAQSLLRRWNENLARREPKAERKSSVQVAFGPGDSSSPTLRTYGVNKSVNSGKSSGSASKDFSNDLNALTLSSTAKEDKSDTCMIYGTEDTINASAWKSKREYKEPWDYQHSYYPTTLPLRRPYSGDPEILDEEEFGEAAASVEYDENKVKSAAELGLVEKSEQQKLLLFKFPPALPLEKEKQSVSRKGKEKVGTSTASEEPEKKKGTPLEGLPRGYVGKMLVYKSGAIKLKLGDSLFDVSPGSNSKFAQDVVAMNTAQKHCCVLGEVGKMAVVAPDIDSVEL